MFSINMIHDSTRWPNFRQYHSRDRNILSYEMEMSPELESQQIDCTNPDFFGFQRAVDVRLWKRGVGYTLGLPQATPTLPLLSMGGGEGWKFQTLGMSCIAASILVSSVQWNGSIKGEIGGGRSCRQTVPQRGILTAYIPQPEKRSKKRGSLAAQGCRSRSILPSRMGARGVSLEHVENMENTEKMEKMEMFSGSPTLGVLRFSENRSPTEMF